MAARRRLLILLSLLLALALSGCATLADKSGIATKQYADERAAAALEQASAASREQLEAQVAALRKELEAARVDVQQARDALAEVEKVVASVSQMQELAKAFEEQLAILPDETLRRLAQILTEYLGQGK